MKWCPCSGGAVSFLTTGHGAKERAEMGAGRNAMLLDGTIVFEPVFITPVSLPILTSTVQSYGGGCVRKGRLLFGKVELRSRD